VWGILRLSIGLGSSFLGGRLPEIIGTNKMRSNENVIAEAERESELEGLASNLYDWYFHPSSVEYLPERRQLVVPIWIGDKRFARVKRVAWCMKQIEEPTRLHRLVIYHAESYSIHVDCELDYYPVGGLRYYPTKRLVSLTGHFGVEIQVVVSALRLQLIQCDELRWDWSDKYWSFR
jgi:hypothetical protein